jgi:excisionase family DNA binding protein
MLFKLILARLCEPVKRKGNKMKTMLTIKETAEKYGLPVFWVRCAVKQHKVPFITLGRKILINGEIFEAFLKGGAPDEQA